MTTTIDPVPFWIRRLADLRAQAGKRTGGSQMPCAEITDSAFEFCDGLLRDLAGARLECERLRDDVRRADDAWENLFDAVPNGCLLTDSAGVIVNANRAASVLLNLSAKRLKDRELVVFSQDREAFASLAQELRHGGSDQLRATLTFRPRERRPVTMQVIVKPLTSRPGLWLWFLAPATAVEGATVPDVASVRGSMAAAR